MDWNLIVNIVLGVVMVLGLLGLLIPLIPGLSIIWLAVLVYALIHGFNLWSGIIFGVITLFVVFGNIVDNLLMGTTAHGRGASWLGVGLALLAGFVISFILSPLGGMAAALVVLFVVEAIRLKEMKQAWKSTSGFLIGYGKAILARMAIGLVIIGLWLLWVLRFTTG